MSVERAKEIWITTFKWQPMQFVWLQRNWSMSAEEYFNKITHNNQGNVKQ